MHEPGLSSIIQGVETSFFVGASLVRVVVTAEALKRYLGAGEDAQSWLAAFKLNAATIESAARKAHAAKGQTTIVLQVF